METQHLAVLYEHPDWFRPLFEELDRRNINPYEKLVDFLEDQIAELAASPKANRVAVQKM